ncbi:DUF6508 domain-containing protein [Streptomyces sp. NPDC021356]|uniref:DUF6508 domain-containing protein n=1 Tax=Streptomyces sp. NPDC021356 TaxID=3154900 RepID=UPI0033F98414
MPNPVHYTTPTTPDGEVIGYLWGDPVEVGWIDRTASSLGAYLAGRDWYRKMDAARRRGLTPYAVVELLSREPGAGPVTGAHSVTALEELSRTVTAADDQRLLAELHPVDSAAWQELADAFGALTDEDRTVRTGGGDQIREGVYEVSYPVYTQPLWRAVHALSGIGAVTPEHRWVDTPLDPDTPFGALHPADAVRAATAIVRGERLCEGTLALAVKIGLLDAVAASLGTWHAARQGMGKAAVGHHPGCTSGPAMPYVAEAK